MDEYKLKLCIKDTVIPDSLTLKDGWLGEKEVLYFWPQLYISVTWHSTSAYTRQQSCTSVYAQSTRKERLTGRDVPNILFVFYSSRI